MLKVWNKVKSAYFDESENKHLIVTFPEINLTLTRSQIRKETMEIKEAILDQESIEFVGCIASQFKLQISSIKKKLKGKKIEVSIYTDSTSDKPVKLFSGIVDSDERTGNKKSKEIKAYDMMYSLADTDVTTWFKTQVAYLKMGKKLTVKKFRNELFAFIGLAQKKRTLANDSFSIKQLVNLVGTEDEEEADEEEEEKIYALDLIKAICQINGVFGIINRNGEMDYRRLGVEDEDDGAYPGVDPDDKTNGLYLPFVPGIGVADIITDSTFYPSYKSVTYEDYDVHGITKVYVRQSEDTKAGYAGSEKKYKYIVQGNRFTLGTTKEEKREIATAILNKVQGVTYTPYTAECTGLPYLEVGDPVQFYVYDFEESDKQKKDVFVLKSFYVLSRTLKGIQSLTDTLTAQGEEKQRRFVSDLGVREDVSTAALKEQADKQDERIKSLEDAADTGLKVESVTALPASPDANTIYLIQGTVG
nr:MAG TPA: hypothetical protein [Caudoviricetes sp.]